MEVYKRFRKGYRGQLLIESRFYACHPLVALLYFIGLFSFLFLFPHPIFTVTSFLFTLVVCFFYIEHKKRKSSLRTAFVFGFFIALMNPLINHRGATILFYFWDRNITLESILYGLWNAVMLCNLMILFMPLNIFIDSERFLYLFGQISPKIAFITSLSLRHTETLKTSAQELTQVQKTRGIDVHQGSFCEKVAASGRLLAAFITRSLEEGMVVSEVLKAKEYGCKKRIPYAFFKMTYGDVLLIIFMCICLIGVYVLASLGGGAYAFYPRLSPLAFSKLTVVAYGMMIAFMMILPVVEIHLQRRRNI